MTTLPTFCRGVLLLALLPAATRAETLEARVHALETQLAALAAENKTLRETKADRATPVAVTAAGRETKLAIGGFAQVHGEAGRAPDSRFAGLSDRFLLRRMRLGVKGAFGREFGFKVEADLGANTVGASSGYRAQLTDAYAEWTAYPYAQVRVGQFKTPFGAEQLMSDTANPFVERSLPNDRLTIGRQIGVGVSGATKGKLLDYSAGLFNGSGVNTSANDNEQFLVAARVGVRVWDGKFAGRAGSWSAGANAFTDRATGTFTGRREGLGFDTQVQLAPFALRAEWLAGAQDPRVGGDVDSDGWSVAALWSLADAWQLAARFETYDPNTATAANETDTLTLGLNWFIRGPDVAVSVNYLAGDADLGGGDDRLLARLQLIF